MNVQFVRIHPDALTPEYQTDGSAAFDLASVEDISLAPGEMALAPTGLIIKTPDNHVLVLAPRSSSPKKKGIGLPHSIGIIDSDYAGPEDEVKLLLQNITNEPVVVKKGDRIVQGMIMPVVKAQFEEVQSMDHDSRGGFGSTGS